MTLPDLLPHEVAHPQRCDVCGGALAPRWSPGVVARDRAHATRGLDNVVIHDAPTAIWRCRECGCLSRALSARALLESEGRYRGARYSAERLDQLRRRARADLDHERRRLARRGLRAGSRVLEIGSYVGALLDLARDEGCRATGVDINDQLLGACRDRGHDVRMGPFAAADFEPGEFDSAWILTCFEELADPRRVLTEVARVLRPDGSLTIRTPNAAFLGVVPRRGARRFLARTSEANGLAGVPFARCFTPRALVAMLREAGYTDVRVAGREFSSLRPVGWPWWWSALRPLRRLAFGVASSWTGEARAPWFEVVARPSRAAAAWGLTTGVEMRDKNGAFSKRAPTREKDGREHTGRLSDGRAVVGPGGPGSERRSASRARQR